MLVANYHLLYLLPTLFFYITMSHPKRKLDEMEHPAAVFGCLPLDLIMDYMEPRDLLACMYLNKHARRLAGPKLNAYKYDVPTLMQQQLFSRWLHAPSVGNNEVFEEMTVEEVAEQKNLAGPLRLGAISPGLGQNFIILKYEKTYEEEASEVAIFNNQGSLVAIYTFNSEQYYESYVNRDVMCAGPRVFNSRGGSNHGVGYINFYHSGHLNPGIGVIENAWKMNFVQTEWAWQEGFCGFVAESNYELFRLFHGKLSPTEVTTVLMHALSSDTRVIYSYVLAVFDNFGWELEEFEESWDGPSGRDDFDEILPVIQDWRERLQGVAYEALSGDEDDEHEDE